MHKCMNVKLSSGYIKSRARVFSVQPRHRSKKIFNESAVLPGAREPGSPSDAGRGEEEEGGGGEKAAG